MTDDLVAFLRARLDEDEQTASRATSGPWIAEFSGETGHCVLPADAQSTREHVARTQLLPAAFDAEHIARHHPARTLAEVEAKRQVLTAWEQADRYSRTYWGQGNADQARARTLSRVVRLLAQPYAGHPDYPEARRP